MNTKKAYQLNYLSAKFYEKYNSIDYPEIENTDSRPYMVVLIKIENNTFAIPFRTNVPHNSCYKFKNFVNDYIAYVNGKKNYYAIKKFKFTTLKYFHNELGINE